MITFTIRKTYLYIALALAIGFGGGFGISQLLMRPVIAARQIVEHPYPKL